jgi:hypothetical protein
MMDYIIRRGIFIGAFFMTLSFCVWPASADWQTPCGCEHLKHIMKTIKADEYAKKRYAEKAQEYEKKDPTPIVLMAQADDYLYFASKGLPKELKEQFGYGGTIGISRDAKSDRADQNKLDQYKKQAICRDDYQSAVAHENYHDAAGLKIKKMKPADAAKADQARSLAKEEISAYEAGLKVLRAARDRLKAQCDWVCDSARKGAGGKSYKDHALCERSCPGTLGSNMKVRFRCWNAKDLK